MTDLTHTRRFEATFGGSSLSLPDGVILRPWLELDFTAVQRLSKREGWSTASDRPEDALTAWHNSWPTLSATDARGTVIGFLRSLTDGEVTTYVSELLVDKEWRDRGIGRALLDACQRLCPHTRLDLLSTDSADAFYGTVGFRSIPGFRRSLPPDG